MRGPNYFNVVSFWEIVLKSMKGKLVVGEPRSWWEDTLHDLAATPLTLRPEHLIFITTFCNARTPVNQRCWNWLRAAVPKGVVCATERKLPRPLVRRAARPFNYNHTSGGQRWTQTSLNNSVLHRQTRGGSKWSRV